MATDASHLRYAFGLGVALDLLLVGLSIATLYQERRQSEALATVTTRNLCQALDTSVTEVVARADQALLTVKEMYEGSLAAGALEEGALERLIAQQHRHLRNVDSLRIALAGGEIRHGIGVRSSPGQTIVEREYYRLHREGKPGLLVSEPVLGKISRKWVVILSRRLDRPGGGFAGVVYAGVLVESLTRLFAALDLGPDGVVALRDERLRLLARYPADSPGLGVAARPVSPELGQLLADGAPSASYFTESAPDGVARVFTFRRVAGGLVLVVGISRDAYLAPWWRSVASVSLLVAVALAGTALALRALRRAALREQEATRQLRRQEERYRIVADHTADWEYWLGPDGTFVYCSPSCLGATGHSAAEFYADPGLLLRVLHPEDRPRLEEHLRKVATRHQGGGSLLLRVLHADGRLRWIDHVSEPIVDAGGSYLGARGSNRDVTETKEQQDLVLAQKRALEATLARTKRLEGIISVCMYCRRINNDNRSWEQMEKYVSDHSDAQFSHGVCPECYEEHQDD